MASYRIALIPGDGVGGEITEEAVRVLDAAADIHGFEVSTETYDWSCDRYLEVGSMMPEDALETLSEFDSIFLGCIGDANKVADHISLQMLLAIRKGFDQYVNLRPIKLYPGVYSPIETASPETVDILVIRENTEGEYSSNGGIFKRGTADAVAVAAVPAGRPHPVPGGEAALHRPGRPTQPDHSKNHQGMQTASPEEAKRQLEALELVEAAWERE